MQRIKPEIEPALMQAIQLHNKSVYFYRDSEHAEFCVHCCKPLLTSGVETTKEETTTQHLSEINQTQTTFAHEEIVQEQQTEVINDQSFEASMQNIDDANLWTSHVYSEETLVQEQEPQETSLKKKFKKNQKSTMSCEIEIQPELHQQSSYQGRINSWRTNARRVYNWRWNRRRRRTELQEPVVIELAQKLKKKMFKLVKFKF